MNYCQPTSQPKWGQTQTFLARLTPSEAERAAGAGHRATVRVALEKRLTVSTFSEIGSFSHGTGVRGYSDIDVLVSLGDERPDSSYTALEWVKDALKTRFPLTHVAIRRPAVEVRFGGGYETWEIVPGFMTARGRRDQYVYDIPGPSAGSAWIDSAPKEHLAYVNECNKKPNTGNAKALARLVKAWKYYNNVPVSSFYLEMRCAQYVSAQATYIHAWDLCLLLEQLHRNGLATMNDPSHASRGIAACSSDFSRRDALSKLSTAVRRARKALEAYRDEKPSVAFEYFDLLYTGHFPPR